MEVSSVIQSHAGQNYTWFSENNTPLFQKATFVCFQFPDYTFLWHQIPEKLSLLSATFVSCKSNIHILVCNIKCYFLRQSGMSICKGSWRAARWGSVLSAEL